MAVVAFLPTAPASATSAGQFTFTGSGTFSSGIDYPCTAPSKPCPPEMTASVKNDAKGFPVVNVTPTGQTTSFFFSSAVCLDTKVAALKDKTPSTAGPCLVTASGTYKGHCGLGALTGLLAYRSSNGTTYSLSFKAFTIGAFTVLGGGTDRTNVHGVLAIQHEPGCQNKISKSFTVAGHVVLKDLTP